MVKLKKIVTLVLEVTLAILVIGLVVGVLGTNAEVNGYIFGYRPVVVVSSSMEPDIPINSVCIVKQIDINEVKTGDIIVFNAEDMRVVHRCIEIKDGDPGEIRLITKGDNNSHPDEFIVTGENVQSRVVKIFNNSGAYIKTLVNDDGTINKGVLFFLCMGVAATALAILFAIQSVVWTINRAVQATERKFNLHVGFAVKCLGQGISKVENINNMKEDMKYIERYRHISDLLIIEKDFPVNKRDKDVRG